MEYLRDEFYFSHTKHKIIATNMRWLLLILVFSLGVSGCTLTRKIEIKQGREELTEERLQAVNGLNAEQVRSMLGPPQSRWNLANQVWIYHYRLKDLEGDEKWQTAEIQFDDQLIVVEISLKHSTADG